MSGLRNEDHGEGQERGDAVPGMQKNAADSRPDTNIPGLSRTEKAVFLDLLEVAVRRLDRAICNDFVLTNTPDNRALIEASIRYCFHPSEEETSRWLDDLSRQTGPMLITMDHSLLAYLRHRFEAQT